MPMAGRMAGWSSARDARGQSGGELRFDVTPRRLISGLITERGICQANEQSILAMFPEHAR